MAVNPYVVGSRSRGQAMIMDAIFFLIICGFASALMLWAVSTYGNTSIQTFKMMYLTDYQNSVINLVPSFTFDFNGTKVAWLDRIGVYMKGELSDRDAIDAKWQEFCDQTPSPMVLTIQDVSRSLTEKAIDDRKELKFYCGNQTRLSNTTELGNYNYYATQDVRKNCGTLVCSLRIVSYY